MLFRYDGDGHNDSNDDNDGEDNMIFEIDEQQVWKCEALNIDGVKVRQSKNRILWHVMRRQIIQKFILKLVSRRSNVSAGHKYCGGEDFEGVRKWKREERSSSGG